MHLSNTLTGYFGRQFASWVLGTLGAILSIVYLLDFVELMRRGSTKAAATIGLMAEMAILKLPQMAEQILPFAVLIGGMFAFSRMTRTHELVVARAAGVSVWQFLLPALVVALALGTLKITLFNPIASAMTSKYETLESKVLKNRSNLLSLSAGGLWVREKTATGHSILHAEGVQEDDMTFNGISVLLFDPEGRFAGRIDAEKARLQSGFWELVEATEMSMSGAPTPHATFQFDTQLTLDNIQDSFASPQTISFWDLPKFIEILEKAGFSSTRHKLHWHSLLATPLLLCAMVLIAATFSLRLFRRGGLMIRAVGGLFFGFLLYFLSDLVFALGLSGRIPEELAAWSPATVTTLLGLASLLHLEDG